MAEPAADRLVLVLLPARRIPQQTVQPDALLALSAPVGIGPAVFRDGEQLVVAQSAVVHMGGPAQRIVQGPEPEVVLGPGDIHDNSRGTVRDQDDRVLLAGAVTISRMSRRQPTHPAL